MIPSEKTLAAALAPIYFNNPHTQPTIKEHATFKYWLHFHFSLIPVPVLFSFGSVSPEEMTAHYQRHNELLISAANNESVWSFTDNLKFRAVHDWHHISGNCSFDLEGEIKAYKLACQSAPESIYWILFSEIVLQAAVAIHTGTFPDQKLVK